MGDGGVVGASAFGSFGFEADAIFVDAAEFGDSRADGGAVRADLGRGQDQRGIEIDEGVAFGGDALEGFFKKDGGVGAFPLRVGGREERADVWGGNGSEEGVGDGVEEDVSVGVASEAAFVGELDASDDERDAALEFVRVVALADAEHFSRSSLVASR